MENCVFCKMFKGEIPVQKIWEDDKYMAFLDNNPIKPGHTLVVPKKHSDYIFDLDDDEYREFFLVAKKVAKLLKSKLNPKRIGIAVEGFGVAHTHIHLIPIDKGFELNPLNAKPAKEGELEEVARKILK